MKLPKAGGVPDSWTWSPKPMGWRREDFFLKWKEGGEQTSFLLRGWEFLIYLFIYLFIFHFFIYFFICLFIYLLFFKTVFCVNNLFLLYTLLCCHPEKKRQTQIWLLCPTGNRWRHGVNYGNRFLPEDWIEVRDESEVVSTHRTGTHPKKTFTNRPFSGIPFIVG